MYGYLIKVKNDLEKISSNAYKQGKSDEQVRQLIFRYLDESKRNAVEKDII